MNSLELTRGESAAAVDWRGVVNYLAHRARRSAMPFDTSELQSMAGLAAARAKAYWDPARATCSFRQWAYSQGWRLMLSEIRDELRRRRRGVREVAFTDLCSGDDDGRTVDPAQCGGSDQWAMTILVMLEGLSQSDRTIVMLRVERWTFRQIGHRFGMSGEAIRLRLARVRSAMSPRECKHV